MRTFLTHAMLCSGLAQGVGSVVWVDTDIQRRNPAACVGNGAGSTTVPDADIQRRNLVASVGSSGSTVTYPDADIQRRNLVASVGSSGSTVTYPDADIQRRNLTASVGASGSTVTYPDADIQRRNLSAAVGSNGSTVTYPDTDIQRRNLSAAVGSNGSAVVYPDTDIQRRELFPLVGPQLKLLIEGDTGFTDQSSTGAAATQIGSTPPAGATYNGHASLSYDGAGQVTQWTNTTLLAALNSRSFAILLVCKSTTNDSGMAVAWNLFSDGSAYNAIMPDSAFNSNKPRVYLVDSGNALHDINSANAATTGALHLYLLRVTPTTAYLSIDGGAEESVSCVPRTDIDRLTVGGLVRSGNSSGVQFDANDTCAVGVYGTPDKAYLATVVSAFKSKYGIT
jgi:hypothetical protein